MCLNKPYEEENEQRESKYVFLQKTLLEKEENTLTNTTTDQLITEHSPMLGREDEIQTAATPSSTSRRASRTVGNEELTVRKTGLSTLFHNPAYSQVTPVAPAKRQEPAAAPSGQLQKSSSSTSILKCAHPKLLMMGKKRRQASSKSLLTYKVSCQRALLPVKTFF